MSLDVDFCAKLQGLTSAPVQQNFFDSDKVQPRVYFQRQNGTTDLFARGDATAGVDTLYVVEVAGTDPDAVAAISDALSSAMNGFRGVMGNSIVLGAFVQDAADDYQPKSLSLDEGYHVFAFDVRLLT